MNIIVGIVIIVILTNMISTYKKKFFNHCDHKLNPVVLAFIIEGILTILFGSYCLYNYKASKEEINYIYSHDKSYILLIPIFLTFVSTIVYYHVLSNTKLSSMSLVRSCLSILIGLMTTQFIIGEQITKSSKIGVGFLFIAIYFIYNGTKNDFIN